MQFVIVIAGIVFVFGLVQWARSGAILLDIHRLLKDGLSQDAADSDTIVLQSEPKQKASQKELLHRSIQRMEMTTDGLLRSSFKVLGILALGMWIFIIASVLVDMLGLDWMGRLSFSANRVIGSPTARSARPGLSNAINNRGSGATRPSRAENARNFRF